MRTALAAARDTCASVAGADVVMQLSGLTDVDMTFRNEGPTLWSRWRLSMVVLRCFSRNREHDDDIVRAADSLTCERLVACTPRPKCGTVTWQ
jgi:hypothetical protein